LQSNEAPAMGLMHDNWQGYVDAWVYRMGVTWMEKTVASPFWTGQTLFEISTKRRELGESKRRKHKLHDDLYAGEGRVAFKGQCFSAPMDSKELRRQLQESEALEEGALVELPVTGERLAQRVRVFITSALLNLEKYIKQATVRREVVVQYIRMLRDAGHPDYAGIDMRGVEVRARRWLPTDAPTVPPEILPDGYLDVSGSEDDEFLGTDKAATPAERCHTTDDLARNMDRARPQTFHIQRDSDVKKDVEASRAHALEQFVNFDLRVSSELEKQFVSNYLPRVFHTTMPWCVGGPDFYKQTRLRRGADTKAFPSLPLNTFLRLTASRVESQFQTDWDFHPAVSSINFASKVNTSPSMAFQKALGAGSNMDAVTDENMSRAAEGLYKALQYGFYKEGDRRIAIAGRVDKLPLCDSLKVEERAILRNFLFMSSRLSGTRQIRRQMRYLVFSACIVYGVPVWVTITPSERHSGLALHLFRGRRNDPAYGEDALFGETITGDAQAGIRDCIGYAKPSLRPAESVTIDLPEYDLRRLITSRYPQACVQAFRVACRIVFPALYGFRM